jgi:ferrous iron transport protein A
VSTLASLSRGNEAIVQSISGHDAIAIRLMEMGIVPGTKIQMIGMAPLGDPLEFELRGFRLSLRKTEAERVSIAAES